MVDTVQIAIVGGGIVGLSIAYHLAARGCRDVCVLDRGRLGQGATAKATGGIRQQFSSEVNIRLSQESLALFERFEEVMGSPAGLRRVGYLFLASSDRDWAWLRQAAGLQRRLGVPTQVLEPEEARRLVDGLRTDDLRGATFCATDGVADPHLVAQAFAREARHFGVRLLEDCEVTGIGLERGRVREVRVKDGTTIACDAIVNAAGVHAREVGLMAGVDLPVEPNHRQVFVAEPLAALSRPTPVTVDLGSGAYVHVEASGAILMGGTDRGDRRGYDERLDWARLPLLVEAVTHRVPALEGARVRRGWAGLREMTPDELAIVGRVSDIEGYFVAAGFSGHGFMHAPAVGRLVADLVLDGTTSGIDISPLSPDRFRHGASTPERAVF
jgi:sarcosine oxidase subunit beta